MQNAKEKMLLIVDPISNGYSVQMSFLSAVIEGLRDHFDLTVYSNYFSEKRKQELSQMGVDIIIKRSKSLPRLFKKLVFPHLNEALLWTINWFFDSIEMSLGKHDENLSVASYVKVLDLSSTVFIKSDVWWIQGEPFYEVLRKMSSVNLLVKSIFYLTRKQLRKVSDLITKRKISYSKIQVASSEYVKILYQQFNINIPFVINSSQKFDKFGLDCDLINKKYVLAYIGKETDSEAIISIAQMGINVIGYGAKIPPGMGLTKLKKNITFLGSVSSAFLNQLYSSAKFFVFPFTNEAFGYTPIEAMLCGVPVLTYNKEGPSETVIDGVTGWLANSKEEFIKIAFSLWNSDDLGIRKEACIARGKELTISPQISKLIHIMASDS
ncbi:MAG: glycosyltransferase [Thermoplasmatales archaeon]